MLVYEVSASVEGGYIDQNLQLHPYVLPVIQGYFQTASFPVPREPEATESGDAAQVDYVIMSRRSRDRAGLRYQRRGIDDDARVANFVETETIMRVEREGAKNIFSYVQIRGSSEDANDTRYTSTNFLFLILVPLFWTQSGYGLKPAPQLSTSQTPEQNIRTLRRHFERTLPVDGPHVRVLSIRLNIGPTFFCRLLLILPNNMGRKQL